MKIEKVNENQIRCTLTKEELADRQIKLSELAYGSEKAKTLFREMMQQANYEFGFEANDIPLMVEAIPLPTDAIVLIITKVEYPEELDTRFSKFSEPQDEEYEQEEPDQIETPKGADDILGLFKKIRKEQEKVSGDHSENESADAEKKASKQEEVSLETSANLTKLFEFNTFEQVERLSRILYGFYNGENDLYKNSQKKRYYLLLSKNEHSPEEFNRVCNIISEYAKQKEYTPAVGAYFEEHEAAIIKSNALQTLASL